MNTITYNMTPVLGDYYSNAGFWFIFGFVVFFYAVNYLLVSSIEGDYTPSALSYIFAVISVTIIGIAGFNSFGKGELCENQPVIAELIDKTYVETYRTGKYSSVIDTHVIYKTPDGEVTYRRSNGTIYSQQATLYKTTCTTIK